MHDADNGDTLLTVAKENDNNQFEKVLVKYMVSSQVISDIVPKLSKIIIQPQREVSTAGDIALHTILVRL